jgi:imidazolonepropionase-like amidohydrolase
MSSVKRIAITLALAAAMLAAGPLAAAGKKALVGGTLVNGLGSTPIRNSVILIDGDTITQVGSVDSLEVPDGYEIISTEAMTVLPGLWDMHVHLMINGHSDYDHWDREYPDRFDSEIMPASAVQLLLAGVTTARDLGAPLEDSISVRDRIASGAIPGPRLFVSGPFIQHRPYPGTEAFRWGVDSPRDGRDKINRLADAGVDVIKLIDQDEMTYEEAEAVVDQAHKRGLKVVAHSHRPEEIRRGLAIGVDNFEHTGLATAPQYPDDVMRLLHERTATGRVRGGPLYWTPTVEGLWNYDYTRDNPEELDTDCWHRGLEADTIADIRQSIAHPEELLYFQLTPKRKPTLKRKIQQLRDAGVVLLVGTDSGIPMKFHCQSTWNELDVWVNVMGIPPMEAIQAATYWPSKFMGVEERWGTLVAGRYADIIAVKGDVLRYINLLQEVDFVMKGGVVYKRDGRPVEESLAPQG